MATAQIKKVIKIGGSLAIILPNEWLKGKIQAGAEMVVIENGELIIYPVNFRTDVQPKSAEVPCTSNAKR